jgi:Ca-activated chloride channel family protein
MDAMDGMDSTSTGQDTWRIRMKSKIRLGFLGLGLVFGAIGVALGACSVQPELKPCVDGNCTGVGGTGGSGGGPGMGGAGVGGSGGQEFADASSADGGGYVDAGPDGSGAFGPQEIPEACKDIDLTPQTFYLSADDSNSMGSPVHVRELINLGFEPNPRRIRTYEFMNYYRFAYDPPALGELAIYPEMEKKGETSATAEFLLGVRSFDAPLPRRPMNLTFLIDTSGSMKGPGLERAKAAVKAISGLLVQNDRISVLTTGKQAPKLDGYQVSGANDPMLTTYVDGLITGGDTDLATALIDAYATAKTYKNDSLMNRVILISDGGANVGVTDTEFISAESADADKEGIYLMGIGTGPALSYNDQLMNDVTEAGRGAYVYLDSTLEAQTIFTERFDETMDIAARGVLVELSLPWYFKVKGISLEEISTTPVTAQHLAPNDAMVFDLEATACDASMIKMEDNARVRVFWRTRVGYLSEITELNVTLADLMSPKVTMLPKARAVVAYAEALKGCGFNKKDEFLCTTETERKQVTKSKLLKARDLALTALMSGSDQELTDIITLINKHPLIAP